MPKEYEAYPDKRGGGRFSAAAIILFIISALVGCMETTTPSNTDMKNLSVKVYMINTSLQGPMIPLQGANVTVFTDPAANVSVSQTTNNEGVAVFQVTAPLIGKNINVLANYNGSTQSKNSILFCNDTTLIFLFDTTTVPSIDCGNLDGKDSVIFIDETGSRRLKTNTPAGIKKYSRCWSLSNNGQDTVTVAIPAVASPFAVESIMLNDQFLPVDTKTVKLAPGSTMTVCFTIPTDRAGVFNQDVQFKLNCKTSSGTWHVYLSAEVVEPQCTCTDLQGTYTFTIPNRVRVGTSGEHSEVVFTNTTTCNLTITQASLEGSNWTILSPAFPLVLKPGESLNLKAKYSPTQAGQSTGVLHLAIKAAGSDNTCTFDITLKSDACTGACPLISQNRIGFVQFSNRLMVDTISNRADNRVFISAPDDPNTATGTFYIFNPDSACEAVTIKIFGTPADQYAAKYFSIEPTTITLNPGQTGSFDVIFTAPTKDELDKIVAARGKTGRITDSLFKITLTIKSGTCQQKLEANAIVTAYPDISPIINLRAYNQKTKQKPEPEYEVYYFGNSSRTINESREYPPQKGDIYIDVINNDPSANPPQQPIQKLINTNITMKLWRSNYPEASFTNVITVVNDFMADPAHSTGYSSNPISPLNVGDVIAFQFSANEYALIYIRRVDDGTENTSSKQSGIEFRSVYPIFVP